MANDKYTILYARLSQDDGSQGESNSIQNQRLILEKYAKENGFENLKFMADDGYSGTNFNRPSFKELMLLVENGEVETIIVKDMSRFGREYLEVGRYTEIVFPNYDVRFIAIADGIDSLYGNDDFTPFKNIINELYAKDCSRKIRAAKRAKAETGAWLGGKPPYGYMRDPENPKSHLVRDEESAEVVKLIFSLCVGGKGPNQIARELKKREILTPAHYYYRKEGKKNAKLNLEQPYKWHSENVIRVLENEVYLGHTISLVNTTKSYKNKKRVVRPTDEQVRFENTHEALVDKETWDIVQKLRESKIRPTPIDNPNIFSGLLYCLDCGDKLDLYRTHTKGDNYNNFKCRTYNKNGKDFCTSHYIREDAIKAIVLDDLRRVTHLARTHESLFGKYLNKKNTAQVQSEISNLQQKIVKLKHREEELKALFKRLYEDNVLGKIPNEVFRALSQDYLDEQKEIATAIPEKEKELEKLKSSIANLALFIAKAKQYPEFPELTSEILHLFIDKIVVGEKSERYSRTAFQQVTIYYRDVGLLDLADTQALQKELGVA